MIAYLHVLRYQLVVGSRASLMPIFGEGVSCRMNSGFAVAVSFASFIFELWHGPDAASG